MHIHDHKIQSLLKPLGCQHFPNQEVLASSKRDLNRTSVFNAFKSLYIRLIHGPALMMESPSITDAFESAKKEFLSQLPKSITHEFASLPTIDHVYQAAEGLQKQQEKSMGMRYLGRVQPFLESLRHYGGVIDTFVQVKPDVLALIWVCRLMKHSSFSMKGPVQEFDYCFFRGLLNFYFR